MREVFITGQSFERGVTAQPTVMGAVANGRRRSEMGIKDIQVAFS